MLTKLILLSICLVGVVSSISIPFNVIQYNIFGRPYVVSHDGQEERLDQIPVTLEAWSNQTGIEIDVITFCEAFIDEYREKMLSVFSQSMGMAYHTTILQDPDKATSITNGGVIIVSRWPIIREDYLIYHGDCSYADCLAAKGVKYARILKNYQGVEKMFNVFATHLQAWETDNGEEDRKEQAAQMMGFILQQEIPLSEPVIMAGDFNVDLHSHTSEVDNLFNLLNALLPNITGDQSLTSDPTQNLLVGRDGASANCLTGYQQSWGTLNGKDYYPSLNTRLQCNGSESASVCFCPCCPFEWLDYVLYSTKFQQPSTTPTLQALPLNLSSSQQLLVAWDGTLEPIPDPPDAKSYMSLFDLSDHYPVLGQFWFEGDGEVIIQDGCKNDNDCHLHLGYCYCDVASVNDCTLQGKPVNGYQAGQKNPVNRHCIFNGWAVDCVCTFKD